MLALLPVARITNSPCRAAYVADDSSSFRYATAPYTRHSRYSGASRVKWRKVSRKWSTCPTLRHKNFRGEDWPQEDFRTLEVLIHAPAATSATTVDLAEQRIVLRNGLTVRRIRRRLANGRQVPVITTHPQMPLDQVAGAMFSRWSQENRSAPTRPPMSAPATCRSTTSWTPCPHNLSRHRTQARLRVGRRPTACRFT